MRRRGAAVLTGLEYDGRADGRSPISRPVSPSATRDRLAERGLVCVSVCVARPEGISSTRATN